MNVGQSWECENVRVRTILLEWQLAFPKVIIRAKASHTAIDLENYKLALNCLGWKKEALSNSPKLLFKSWLLWRMKQVALEWVEFNETLKKRQCTQVYVVKMTVVRVFKLVVVSCSSLIFFFWNFEIILVTWLRLETTRIQMFCE